MKSVRKFALEHFKRRRAPHGNATRQPTPLAAGSVGVANRVYVGNGNEAGTSSSLSLSAGSIKFTRLSSVDALELASVVKVSKPTGTKPKLPKRLRATPTTISTSITPRTSLRHKQYKQRLQNHPYTDVDVAASELRKMAQQNGDNE